jgi:hypothetical protein
MKKIIVSNDIKSIDFTKCKPKDKIYISILKGYPHILVRADLNSNRFLWSPLSKGAIEGEFYGAKPARNFEQALKLGCNNSEGKLYMLDNQLDLMEFFTSL